MWSYVAGISYDLRPNQFRYADEMIKALGTVVRSKVFYWEENERGLGEAKVRFY